MLNCLRQAKVDLALYVYKSNRVPALYCNIEYCRLGIYLDCSD